MLNTTKNKTLTDNIIDKASNGVTVENIKNIDNNDELKEVILDFDNDLDVRMFAFNSLAENSEDHIIELCNKLSCMYLITGTVLLKELLINIIKNSKSNS